MNTTQAKWKWDIIGVVSFFVIVAVVAAVFIYRANKPNCSPVPPPFKSIDYPIKGVLEVGNDDIPAGTPVTVVRGIYLDGSWVTINDGKNTTLSFPACWSTEPGFLTRTGMIVKVKGEDGKDKTLNLVIGVVFIDGEKVANNEVTATPSK